ncbi:hypothetical protein D9756_005378 [Leucocoprinus leucothites]|uniref:Rad26 atrip n=1 Tax=Leucocoprinus leucothites TaxID=201217 RepID=A0A8H5D7I1_9AGAR|nr:hypothetical protein D9756_005378 [Leucoagaricus leucothites]
MDDIDDYFDDDLVLDDRTLAILDREEKKYLSQRPQQPPPPLAVTKKQKTRDGWSPGVGSRAREHDFDDLPEISVTVDGNYGFTDSTLTSGSSNQSQPPRQATQPNAPPPRGPNHPNPRFLPPAQPVHIPPRPAVSTITNRSSPIPSSRPRIPDRAIPTVSNGNGPQPGFQTKIAELQVQLQELRNENQKVQAALREATDIRYVKEGEVSILRKNIEQTARNHATEIAKMKAAREELEAKQKQMERQMKEETERLKTQFMFKQHELEASLRRPPSARGARINKNAPATPVRVPAQISAWRISQDTGIGQRLSQTPRQDTSSKPSPRAVRVSRRSPEGTKRSAFLPGFQNSFVTTPLKPDTKFDLKGKGRDLGREESIEISYHPSQRLTPTVATPVHQRSTNGFEFEDNPDATPISDDPMPHIDEDGDSVMLDGSPEEVAEEVEPIEPLNRKIELSRIILTHTHKDANETTFQTLIGIPHITGLSEARARECIQAAQSIMLALSNPADDADYELCFRQVTKYLTVILRCLLGVDPCFPAAALLSLLRSLAVLLPNFNKILESENEDGPLLFVTLLDLLDHLTAVSSDTATLCINELILLLESILSHIPDETVSRLTLIPQGLNSLFSLLSPSQPCEILECLSRVFLLLTTCNLIHAQILALLPDGNPEISGKKDSTFVHYLCTYLLDNFGSSLAQNLNTYSNLVGCFAQLSLSQAEQLVQSNTIVPTLTYMIAEMSMKLWTDDGSSFTESESRLIIRFISQNLFLLHYLIYSSEPTIRLHDKLQHYSHQNLNNLVHMFVVSFGQLSYADPPDWIDGEGKAELECLVDTARDLLDLAVDGPEGDSVWEAYQMEPDSESETDDEEREARLMDSNMQS